MRVWTDGKNVSDVGYIRKGNGIMINAAEYRIFPIKFIPATLLPFKKYTSSRTNLSEESDNNKERFINESSFRRRYVEHEIHIYTSVVRWDLHGNVHSTQLRQYDKLYLSKS